MSLCWNLSGKEFVPYQVGSGAAVSPPVPKAEEKAMEKQISDTKPVIQPVIVDKTQI